jgi:hypothetical protein
MPKKIKKVSKKRTTTRHPHEADSKYLLKIVLYLAISSQWLRLQSGDTSIPLPIGALIAVFFALHEHFQIDRKIELALILAGMFIAFWLPMGIYIKY